MKSPRTIHISIITIALLQNFTSNGIDTPFRDLSPIVNKVKMTGPTSEVGTDTLPEHQSALPTCSGICAAQS
jgi:hypothetical protein